MSDNRAADHAIDMLLAEELGERRPPDLEARIIAAADRRTVELPMSPGPSNSQRGQPEPSLGAGRRTGLTLAMALGAAGALLSFAL